VTRSLFGRSRTPSPRVLAFIDLPQDVEVMSPVLCGATADDGDGWDLKIRVSRWLKAAHPEAVAELMATGLRFRFVRRSEVIEGRAPDLRGVDALLTASESSHPAHTAAHALALRSRASGIRTYTLQHGLENVGLGMGEPGEIASDVVFSWFPPAMTATLPEEVGSRLVPVGRSRMAVRRRAEPRYAVGVFENLHAERYGEAEREAFLAGFSALAATGAPILLRPHPAGRWSTGLDLGRWPNVLLQLEGGGQAAVESAARIITTPSTVVLDAAQAGRPVALAGEPPAGGDLYRPFPVLRSPADWSAFAASQHDQAAERQAFLDRVLLPGDAAGRIARTIRDDLTRRLAPR
jgi:hypothetical protein